MTNLEEIKKDVDKITDRLGKPIDEGIKGLVIALKMHGFITMGSCEGHLDWGLKYPWVDIGSRKLPQDVEKWLEGNPPVKERLEHPAIIDLKIKNRKELRRLIELLSQFYVNKRTEYSKQLTVRASNLYGLFRLEPLGAALQDIFDSAEQKDWLENFREEFSAFTEFLIKKGKF